MTAERIVAVVLIVLSTVIGYGVADFKVQAERKELLRQVDEARVFRCTPDVWRAELTDGTIVHCHMGAPK